MQQRDFLLINGTDELAQTLSELTQRHGVLSRAGSFHEAARSLVSPDSPQSNWAGLVVDLDGLDESPLGMLDELRQTLPLLPVLLISSSPGPSLINQLHVRRAELIVRPFGSANIASFVERALVSGWLPEERVTAWSDELARQHNLSSSDVQLLAYAVGTESHRDVMRRLGINELTLKNRVRALLRKVGVRTLDGLAKVGLREALVPSVRAQLDDDALFDEEMAEPPQLSPSHAASTELYTS